MERGAFYLRYVGEDCIAGKYFNDVEPTIYTENAIRVKVDDELPEHIFCGTYVSTWMEDGLEAKTAELVIAQKENSGDIYTLNWQKDGKPLSTGDGMIVDGLLVGHYSGAGKQL
jgi:hypothetical protein